MSEGKRALPYWLAYALIWGGSVGWLALRGADWTSPIMALILFGAVPGALGWWLTRRAAPPETVVARPKIELAAILLYLALYAFLFLGPG